MFKKLMALVSGLFGSRSGVSEVKLPLSLAEECRLLAEDADDLLKAVQKSNAAFEVWYAGTAKARQVVIDRRANG